MGGRYLLDTNILIALFGNEVSVQARVAQADDVYIPAPALGELYFGAYKSGRPAANIIRVTAFATASNVLSLDLETTREYGSIRENLRQKGRPIPNNDLWIAAIAMQHGLTVATRDQHFTNVDGLNYEMW